MNLKKIANLVASFAPGIENKIRYWYALFFPKKYSKRIYFNFVGKRLDLNNPVDFNEKIQWLKFYSDTSMWSDLADKYKVREYVEKCGLCHILNKLYVKYDKVKDIDITDLPDSFVLKMNNGCGEIFVVNDKTTTNNDEIRAFFKKKMKHKYGVFSGEPHYLKIKPCIIAEKLLLNDNPALSSSLIDYKLYSFHGKVRFILVCTNRNLNLSKSVSDIFLYDADWNPRNDCLKVDNMPSIELPKPISLAAMIEAAEILSKPFPFVRVDFYEISGQPVFGEMTFTPGAGVISDRTDEFLKELGSYIELPK